MSVKVSVIIPAYNESENIVDVLNKIKKTLKIIPQPYEIIVIDDASSDDTGQKARECDIKVIKHEKKQAK